MHTAPFFQLFFYLFLREMLECDIYTNMFK